MKIKASVILALLSLAALLSPKPSAAAGLTLNPIQGIVGSGVSILNISSYGSGQYQVLWGEARQVVAQGNTAGLTVVGFTVPESPRGKQKVYLTVGSNTFDAEFTVLPSIRLDAREGYVGNNLVVRGNGFNANETSIEVTFGGAAIGTGVVSDNLGNWETTLKIPPTRGGSVTVDAGSAITPALEVEDRTFTVIPRIEVNPTAGGVGTLVMVTGTGFGSTETGINIVYDGIKVKTGIASDNKGSWQGSFYVPTSARGGHRITCYGDVTGEATVAGVSFSVSPVMKLELASGQLGDAIKVGDDFWASGIGFEANEGGIQVTFDGLLIASGITADAKGTWAVRLKVPLTSRGKHVVDAAGNTTRADDVADGILIVSPQMEISPTSGGVGTEVTVSGNGFGSSQPLVVSFGGMQVVSGQSADARGSFSLTFKVPKGKPGDHAVTVTDATGSVALATFNTETTPPPVPKLVAPEAGSKFGMVGPTVVAFQWTAVEDPSGVSYVLEISSSSEFTGTVLRRDGIDKTEYTLTKEEALSDGSYYWRVKAVDGAGNESGWTTGQLFRIGGELWIFAVALATVLILALIIWRVVSLSRKGWR